SRGLRLRLQRAGGLLHGGALRRLACELLQLLIPLAAGLRAQHVAGGQANEKADSIEAHLGLSRGRSRLAGPRWPARITRLTAEVMPGMTIVMRMRSPGGGQARTSAQVRYPCARGANRQGANQPRGCTPPDPA